MSLKSFHIFFIVLAILCTLGFCAWVYQTDNLSVGLQVAGGASGVIGIGLVIYGVWFVIKKARKIIV